MGSKAEEQAEEVKEYVKKRYGAIAKSCQSCSPSCECGTSTVDVGLKIGYSEEDLKSVPEAANMGLGCGNPVALANLKEGETVLDLGSGGGIDAFLASKVVGPKGKVIGIDMAEEMVERATSTAKKYGYKNVEFRVGEMENLPLMESSVDVVISNCVINLAPDKDRVFREAHRVLKRGGRIMISDLVTEGELPGTVKKSFEAWAACIAGAMDKTSYLKTIQKTGFENVRIVSESTYDINISDELKSKITSVKVEAYKA